MQTLMHISWEPLEEQAPEGQWSYHERLAHTSTQKP
jgi:NADH dehydrogenase (ubiquinone) 1 alpha subcomplex subunit 5